MVLNKNKQLLNDNNILYIMNLKRNLNLDYINIKNK